MKTIIVGVDASDRTSPVLEAARIMAERLDAKVVIVSAIEGMEWQANIPPELAAWNGGSLWVEIEKQTQARVDDAAHQHFPAGTVIEKCVDRGQAWRLLCDAAKKRAATLIIVGAHGYRVWERMIGTTAAKVANRAETSVLVVRQRPNAQAPIGFERVLVAHDGSERAAQVLQSAQSLAAPSAGRLILVRGINTAAHLSSQLWGKRPEEIEAYVLQLGKTALDGIRGSLPDRVPAESVARIGSPAEIVVETAKEKDATLLVVGSHGYDAVDRVLGTTAGRIVNHTDRSVLIVRGQGVA